MVTRILIIGVEGFIGGHQGRPENDGVTRLRQPISGRAVNGMTAAPKGGQLLKKF